MKKLSLLTLATSLFLISCDECKDVNCLNAGVCEEGTCVCLDGFSGNFCEIEDECITKAVTCDNDKECLDGDCQCGDWYSGTTCSIKNVDEFVGPYQGMFTSAAYDNSGSVSLSSGEGENELTITEYTGRVYDVEFVTAKTFNIPTQTLPDEFGYGPLEVSGSGKLTDAGSLEYSINYNYPNQGSSTTAIYSGN